MSLVELERPSYRALSEKPSSVSRRKFSIGEPAELEPLIMDWDRLAAERLALFPAHSRENRGLR